MEGILQQALGAKFLHFQVAQCAPEYGHDATSSASPLAPETLANGYRVPLGQAWGATFSGAGETTSGAADGVFDLFLSQPLEERDRDVIALVSTLIDLNSREQSFKCSLCLSDRLSRDWPTRDHPDLTSGLGWVAEVVSEELRLPAVALLLLDQEGNRLAVGCHGSALDDDQILNVLTREIAGRSDFSTWSSLTIDNLRTSAPSIEHLKLRITGDHELNIVALHSKCANVTRLGLHAIQLSGPVILSTIAALQQAASRQRIDQLFSLARDARDSLGPRNPNLLSIIEGLKVLFGADVVTLWLAEGEILRLASSTDSSLMSSGKPNTYRKGQGLTGKVFEIGEAIRLRSVKNREEIKARWKFSRARATHPEHTLDGVQALQFLAVPVRNKGRTEGVLRMSRVADREYFSAGDESSLQFFADLLGTALAQAWDLWRLDTLLQYETVALVISRRESGEEAVARITEANCGAANLHRCRREDLIGRDAKSLYVEQEYEKLKPSLRPKVKEALQKGCSEFVTTLQNVPHPDGSSDAVQISYRIVVDQRLDPPSLYTFGLAVTTTKLEEQRTQLEHLQKIMEDVGIAYFRTDPTGKTIQSSPAESRITGWSVEELDGFDRNRLYRNKAERRKLIDQLRNHGGRLVLVTPELVRKDGSPLRIQGDMRVVLDQNGEEKEFEGFYRDVTERLRLQEFVDLPTDALLSDEQLFRSLKEAAQLNLDYVSSVSHQLLTPLSSLLRNLEEFQEGALKRLRVTDRLPYIVGQTRVCMRSVRNLSYIDKVLRDEPFQREDLSLGKLAVETKLDFLHLLDEKSLVLDVDDTGLDHNVPIRGDRELLRQILINLVDNAIKYSFSKTTIAVRGKRLPEGRAIEISNRGLSIPPAIREEIFKRGFRSKKAQMSVPHGTGLGLWLVRKIVEAHDGKITCTEVHESYQKRNLFRIVFPHPQATGRRAS